ncbi:hypothetical protein H4R26_003796 [Coemansia thaxteri]|uniref:DNA-directed RNA polymerase III subunit RPC4 n=1 Tax=Coemansia thaxteri TaxID=2663907 RepID=A0A9W8EI67_9FUNG|nr:hypothetical protein H4R26_003796 [Coemansia thaxteri]KAJ2485349.1 hypothetical protein EV174_001793 [Coemansia sp. RSA 2320]
MPDIPDEKPTRGRGGTLLPRGRGRGRGSATAAGALPTERLSSIRSRPATPAAPAASTGAAAASGSSSGSSVASPAAKMRFTPTIPARRVKKEPSALLASGSDSKPTAAKREFRPERGRGGTRGRGGRPELIQSISGPFAQGPASLASNSGARRNPGSLFLGSGGGGGGGRGGGGGGGVPGAAVAGTSSGTGGDGEAKPDADDDLHDPNDPNAPVLLLTDHNADAHADEFAVQTEEMAIEAAEIMNRLALDTSAAELFTVPSEESRLVVLQLPAMPVFELSEDAAHARRLRKREEMAVAGNCVKAEQPAVAPDMDVKPGIAELAALPVAGAVQLDASSAMAVDVKPDIAALSIADEEGVDAVGVSGEDAEDMLEGRVGTLVLLKSGAVKMKIGDILLDVSRGADCQFFRALLALDSQGTASNTAFLLGNVDALAVCTPDLEGIL